MRMLSKVFAVENDWSDAPRDTYGVERVNLESKEGSPSCLPKGMDVLDKVVGLPHIGAERNISLSYSWKQNR